MAKQAGTTKKPMTRAQLAVTLAVAILVMIGANLVLFLSTPSTRTTSDRTALFGVKKIVVEGNTRYKEESIIGKSGIRIGDSVFSVDKQQAAENIRSAFAYAETVTVDNKQSMDTIRIKIEEATPLGVIAIGDQWMLVSTTGRGLEAWKANTDTPMRDLHLKGTTSKKTKVGEQVLDDRGLKIANALIAGMKSHGLEGLTEINMTDKTDIQVNWKNQITFLLGNDQNMEHKLAVIAATLPKIQKDHGNTARGTLNVRDYSDNTVQDKRIVFRPEGLVTTKAAGATTGTTKKKG